MQKFEGDGQHRLAQAHEIEGLTAQGWNLVFSYQDTERMACTEEELVDPALRGQYPYNNNGGKIALTKWRPGTVTRFLLRKSEDAVREELLARVSTAEERARFERSAREGVEATVARLTKRADELEQGLTRLREDHAHVSVDRDRHRSSAAKLEGDLAKIRTAIGERQFAEILPPAPKAPK
jgi:hypothetical protein